MFPITSCSIPPEKDFFILDIISKIEKFEWRVGVAEIGFDLQNQCFDTYI